LLVGGTNASRADLGAQYFEPEKLGVSARLKIAQGALQLSQGVQLQDFLYTVTASVIGTTATTAGISLAELPAYPMSKQWN